MDEQKWHMTYQVDRHPDVLTREQVTAIRERWSKARRPGHVEDWPEGGYKLICDDRGVIARTKATSVAYRLAAAPEDISFLLSYIEQGERILRAEIDNVRHVNERAEKAEAEAERLRAERTEAESISETMDVCAKCGAKPGLDR